MTSASGGGERDVAAEYLRAELQPKRGHGVRAVVDALLSTVGADGSIALYDLVVSRIDTGAEVIRTKADVVDPHHLLGQVELDLETKTVAEFLEEWRPA